MPWAVDCFASDGNVTDVATATTLAFHRHYTDSGNSDSFNTTLSDEFTTDTLISNTEGALPDYDGDFDDGCGASRDLSEDEISFHIARFKPKFTIGDPLENDLEICYNEHFDPDDGDPVDTPKTVVIPAGETEVIGDEVMEPDVDGEVTITDITCGPCEE